MVVPVLPSSLALFGPSLLDGASRLGAAYLSAHIETEAAAGRLRIDHDFRAYQAELAAEEDRARQKREHTFVADQAASAAEEARALRRSEQAFSVLQSTVAFRRQLALSGLNAATWGAAGLAQTGLQVWLQHRLARAVREFERERELAESEHRKKLAEDERRYQIEQSNDEHAKRIIERRLADRDARYPFDHGPSHLRDSLMATYPDPRHRPLLIVIAPPGGESARGAVWAGLPERVRGELMRYQDPRFGAEIRVAQRPVNWPDIDLYVGDLTGLPTVILELGADKQRLDLRLGGCHLIPDALSPLHEMRSLCTLYFPRASDWSEEEITLLRSRSGPVGLGRLPSPQDPEGLAELNHELAARLITLSIMAAVDCYHIMHTPAYEERLDQVVRAAGTAGAKWPVDYGIPLDAVCDPAYHLLQRVTRQARAADAESGRGDPAAATDLTRAADADLLLAVSLLAGHDSAREDLPFGDLLAAAVKGPIASESHLARLRALLPELSGKSAYGGLSLPAPDAAARHELPRDDRNNPDDPNTHPLDP